MVAKKTEKKEEKDEIPARGRGALEFAGLKTTDGEPLARFIASVEDAFEALHQPGFGQDGDEAPEAPIALPRFVEWAKSVEGRLEQMGLAPFATIGRLLGTRAIIDPAMLSLWTQRVWARFAALGQVIPDPTDE